MTEPTDAEIIALADETRTGEPGRGGYILPISFARAVLAKWGTQQPAHSGEPVAWKHDCAALLMNDVELWIDACPHCGKPRNAPQPVEREPLTPERVKEIVRGAGYDQCGIPDTERSAFINGLRHGEREHGIGETP